MSKRVLITGFGDFENVKDNLSWKGVESMDRDRIQKDYEIIFFKEQIDVAYKAVERSVPKLWAKHQPDLTIHVGVKDKISWFELETQANRECYKFSDIEKFCPPDYKHFADGPDTITTDLDLVQVRDDFNAKDPKAGLEAKISNNAGQYVCEYTYYTSLACRGGGSKTLFVHVPYVGYTKEQIAAGLERILDICLQQMRN